MRISVIISSINRRQVLHDTVLSLLGQTLQPAQVLLSVPAAEHVEPTTLALPKVERVLSSVGLTAQRNAGVAHVDPEADLVAFFDDDVELAPDCLERAATTFDAYPGLCLLTGDVLDDGARRGGIPREEARRIIAATPAFRPGETVTLHPVVSAYGCNMVVRRSVLTQVKFDERLPLYSWLEDLDFSHYCRQLGDVAYCAQMRLVHLAAISGRVSGHRFGFSQIMNSFYLNQKGSLPLKKMLVHCWAKPIIANLVLGLLPAGRINRRGRLAGNLIALAQVMRNHVCPEYILEMR
jgi:GT2 family glycosyltransferase